MSNTSTAQLAAEITRSVQEYTEDVSEAVATEVETTTDKVLKEVRVLARKRTGEYARTFIKTDKSLPGKRRYVVWNRKHYRRVHLLELGHAKRGGGRVKAFPHLVPAHDKYAGDLENNIKKIIRNGG